MRAVELVARDLPEGVTGMVTDRGEGLDRAVATRSFEQPFSTGEGVLRKEKSGVGTGLHLWAYRNGPWESLAEFPFLP